MPIEQVDKGYDELVSRDNKTGELGAAHPKQGADLRGVQYLYGLYTINLPHTPTLRLRPLTIRLKPKFCDPLFKDLRQRHRLMERFNGINVYKWDDGTQSQNVGKKRRLCRETSCPIPKKLPQDFFEKFDIHVCLQLSWLVCMCFVPVLISVPSCAAVVMCCARAARPYRD